MTVNNAEHAVPRHVAIIMDGNGRWARRRGLPRLKGHERGAESIQAVMRACRNAGVDYLTLYAFSTENWSRPKAEIDGLMRLLRWFLRQREKDLHEHQVRLRVAGRLERFPAAVRKDLARVMDATAGYTRAHLILALNYGGRAELVDAMRALAARVQVGELTPDAIDEALIGSQLYVPDVPDPDLLIRTSGEMRVSNFLTWQTVYTEFYFTETLWPDFGEEAMQEALRVFAGRERRFGRSGS